MTELNNTELANVMRRVQKLLAIAQDSRADANEAAAAASQAEKIMRKYQIDNADVISASFRNKTAAAGMMKRAQCSANMKRDDPKRPPLKKNPAWAGWLGYRLAMLYDVQVLYCFKAGHASVEFRGYEADVDMAAFTFDYLVSALIGAMKAYQRSGVKRSKVESESYRRGFVLALCVSLQRMKEDKDEEMNSVSSSRALVVLKMQAVDEHYGEAKYGTAKASKATVIGSAYAAGRAAGERVDVSRRGVGSNSAPLAIN